MNALENMYEERFPNIDILTRTIYYIPLLTIKIKIFLSGFFIISDLNMYYFMSEEMKRKTQNDWIDFTF